VASFQDRVIGAMRLRAATFEDVEHDTSATAQAAIVVTAVGVANGVAWMSSGGISGIVLTPVYQLVSWVIGSFVLLMVGTKLFPGKATEADMGQMLRTLGFAQSAGLVGVLGIVPLLGWVVLFVVWIWMIAATVVAVRQALDYDDTMKAVIVSLVAWVIIFVVNILGAILGAILGFGGVMTGGMF
jgi:hypothetical protein